MSTERQDLSAEIQRNAIAAYAEANGFEIVATYEDLGRSGLRIENRGRMKNLIADVMADTCPFRTILVYDVSRWGRFQDTDESAYYEYHCRRYGVRVVYVGEPFSAEISPLGAVIKSLKRAMAAEYSRELGIKCRSGQLKSFELGHQMGSLPCIGFRRVAVRKDTGAQRPLGKGDMASKGLERIHWVLGPPDEVELVKRAFALYLEPGATLRTVAQELSSSGARSRLGLPLDAGLLADLFRCEAVIGNFLWSRMRRLPGEHRKRKMPTPLRQEGTIERIIDDEQWAAVQAKLVTRIRVSRSNARMLDDLRAALAVKPSLNDRELPVHGCATAATYRRRFGSMRAAFELAGRNSSHARPEQTRQRAEKLNFCLRILRDIAALLTANGVPCSKIPRRAAVRFGSGKTLRLQVSPQCGTVSKARWPVPKYAAQTNDDYILIARFQADRSVADFFLVTRAAYSRFPACIAEGDRPRDATWINSHHGLVRELSALTG